MNNFQDEIENNCLINFGVSFTVFEKIEVNGKNTHPLFVYIKNCLPGFLGSKNIKWNFTKFLFDRKGTPIKRFATITKPEKIERDLNVKICPNDRGKIAQTLHTYATSVFVRERQQPAKEASFEKLAKALEAVLKEIDRQRVFEVPDKGRAGYEQFVMSSHQDENFSFPEARRDVLDVVHLRYVGAPGTVPENGGARSGK